MTTPAVTAVVFDLGGVLIDWNPRHLYRTLFDDEAAMERFLAEVCTPEWNARQDAGRPWSEAIDELVRAHPAQRELIQAYHERWDDMLGGEISGTVQLLAELRRTGLRLIALSNWSAETYPSTRARFSFLGWFEAVVISGDVGLAKPDPRIYRHLIESCALDPAATVFIDDSQPNVDAATAAGLVAIRFEGAGALRRRLAELGVPASGERRSVAAS